MTLTNQLFYDQLVVVNSVPLNGSFLGCSTVSQNIFLGVLYREETSRVFWRTNKKVGVVCHGRLQIVVGNSGKWWVSLAGGMQV